MSNFSKLIWKQCEILHNTAHEYTDKCIIGIPVYKSILTETEKASLNQLCKIIGHSYEICLICPDDIQLNDYINIAYNNGVYLSFLFCAKDYFKSTETYSYLCETAEFYKCFKKYDYLFIYQLDGWIFSNLLYYYINLNVDYIGGLWNDGHKESIGNGGVSLRRVQKFIDICEGLTEEDYKKDYVKQEDIFFCETLRNKVKLKFPSLKIASNFALTNRYQYFIQKYNNNHLPMCLHAWNKNYDILHNYIKIEYNEGKHICNNKITFKNLNTFNEILKLNIVKSQKENKEIKKKYFNNQHNIQMPTKYNWNTFIEKYYNIPQKKTIKETQELIMPKKQIIPKNTHIIKSDKIIVSFTSWPKRINKCVHTIELMLTQTLMPDKIILNLSYDEFKNKENDLPIDLLQIIKNNELCEIYWVKENTKPYKKLIPTLKRFPNDVIITIDDDIEYPLNFVEEMYKEYLAYDKQCPITGSKYEWQNGIYNHFGCYSLVKGDFFGKYIFDLYENLYVKNPNDFPLSDPLFTYAILLNGRRYKATETINMDVYRKKAGQDTYSISKLGNKQYIESRNKEHKLIREYIKKTYNKTYEQLFEAPIYINITTWKQRDKYLPQMLKNLSNQTMKPNKIILWLSKEEYSDVPSHIQQCLKDKLLTEIKWVDKNIYCHKRHETFKINNDVYNMCMDDDLLYEQTYIENLYKSSIQHPNAISAMAGSRRDFNGIKTTSNLMENKCDNKNAFLGGLTCYPPYTFPIESFKHINIRDKYSQKCDETWIWCWCIKKGIKINILKYRGDYKLNIIGDSYNSALWNENKVLNSDNLTFKEEMLHNVIYQLNIQDKIKELFPKYKIYKNNYPNIC